MSSNLSSIIIKPPFLVPEIDGWQGWTVLGLIGFMLIALVAELAPPYLVMMGTLVILLALSILDVDSALHGFADEAMLSVAVLFVVAKGIEQSGGLEYVASILFSTPDKTKELRPGHCPSKMTGSIVWVLLKFSVPVAIFSAFLANIPLVAMMIPPIVEFGKKVNLPPSMMLMPLSFAAQLGGTMTLIGAGTNLVVLSMAAQKLPELKMNLFEIGIIGVPVTIAGIFYIIALSGKLLPDRLAAQPTSFNAREYNVVLVMKPTSKLARKMLEKSGISRQPGLTLLSVIRDGTETKSPSSDFVLQAKDRLHFVGVIDSVLLLLQLNGLALSEDEGQDQVDLNRLKMNQCLVEAVVASGSPMVNKRIADLQFRERYKASIVAVHRYGTRLSSGIGDINVEAGDCLLMVVSDAPEFVTKHRNNSTFALVAQLPGFKPVNRKKAGIAAVLVMGMVVASGVGMKLITAALFSSAGLLLTKCLSPRDAMESIELPVLIMIAAAFGIAEGMVVSGAATLLAKGLMGLAGKSLFGLISCTYVATTIFSLAITNSAAVTIMFPVALAAANNQKMDFRPFAYILMMAASAGFMTPTGCPTNLMVYTPGGYRFSDFIKYGGPMQILLAIVTIGVTMTAKYWWAWWLVIILITLVSVPLIATHKSTHPKPVAAPAPDVRPSTPDADVETPDTALNAGKASSSDHVIYSTALTDNNANFSRGPSSFHPTALPNAPKEAPASTLDVGNESLSRRKRESSTSSIPLSSFAGLAGNPPNSQVVVPITCPVLSSSSTTSTILASFSTRAQLPLPSSSLPQSDSESMMTKLRTPSQKASSTRDTDSSVAKQSTSSPERMSPPSPKPPSSESNVSPVEKSPSPNHMSRYTQIAGGSETKGPSSQYVPSPIQISLSLVSGSESIPSSLGPEPPSSEPAILPVLTPTSPGLILSSDLDIATSKPTTLPVQKPRQSEPVSDSIPFTPGPATILAKRISLPPQEQAPPILVPLPIPSIPGPNKLATKRPSLLQQNPPIAVPVPIPMIPGPGSSVLRPNSVIPQEQPSPIAVALPIPSIPGPGSIAGKRTSFPFQEQPRPIAVAKPIPIIPGPGTVKATRASLLVSKQDPLVPVAVPIPSVPGAETKPPKRPNPGPVDVPIPLIESSRSPSVQDSSKPLVLRTYIPKRPSDLPLPFAHIPAEASTSSSSQNLANGLTGSTSSGTFAKRYSLTNGQTRRTSTSEISGSESTKAPPLFFTSPSPSHSLKVRRPSPQPWVELVQSSALPSLLPTDVPQRRSSRIAEEDLTGGISNLLNTKRLSSIKDVDAFADRWRSTIT